LACLKIVVGIEYNPQMTQEIRFRKSPGLLTRNLILIQISAFLGYFIISTLADYGTYYSQYSVSDSISYQVVRFGFFILAELILTAYVFMNWFMGEYSFQPTVIVNESGALLRSKKTYVITPPFEISKSVGIFGKIFNHGTLIIKDKFRQKPVILTHVPEPNLKINELEKMQKRFCLKLNKS